MNFTQKPDALYVLCARWPQAPLAVGHVAKADGVSLLGCATPVSFTCAGGTLTIQPPPLTFGTLPCDFAWTFKIANPR